MNQQDRDILETLIEYNEKRLEKVENHQITLNSEMGYVKEKVGEVRGELRTIKWFLGGSLLLLIGQLILQIYP